MAAVHPQPQFEELAGHVLKNQLNRQAIYSFGRGNVEVKEVGQSTEQLRRH